MSRRSIGLLECASMANDGVTVPKSLQLRRESTAEAVATALRDLIVDGALAPGTHLPEGPLAEQLGVSRNTVREATMILVSQGVVRREIHRGAFVAELGEDDVRDIFRVREMVELAAVRELIATSTDLSMLEQALADLVSAVEAGADTTVVLDADLRFHQALVDLIDSDRFGALYASMGTEMSMSLAAAAEVELDTKQLVRDLRALLAAMRKGDGDKAQDVLRRHLANGQRRLLARLAA